MLRGKLRMREQSVAGLLFRSVEEAIINRTKLKCYFLSHLGLGTRLRGLFCGRVADSAMLLASIPGHFSWGKGGLVYFARACAKLFVYLSILHTKFHIQFVYKRKMYTEEKYVRPDLMVKIMLPSM